MMMLTIKDITQFACHELRGKLRSAVHYDASFTKNGAKIGGLAEGMKERGLELQQFHIEWVVDAKKLTLPIEDFFAEVMRPKLSELADKLNACGADASFDLWLPLGMNAARYCYDGLSLRGIQDAGHNLMRWDVMVSVPAIRVAA